MFVSYCEWFTINILKNTADIINPSLSTTFIYRHHLINSSWKKSPILHLGSAINRHPADIETFMKDIISVSGMLLKTGLQILQISGRGIKILPPNLRGEKYITTSSQESWTHAYKWLHWILTSVCVKATSAVTPIRIHVAWSCPRVPNSSTL